MPRQPRIVPAIIALTLLGAASPLYGAATADAGTGRAAPAPVSVDSGFRPSADGFDFKNSFSRPDDNWFVKLGGGRCGGMAYAALDHFYGGGTPGTKQGDAELILRRNIDSLVGNGARFVLWTTWSSVTGRLGPDVTDISRSEELPQLAERLEQGPVPLGLVRTQSLSAMKLNHQVVAYAMQMDGDIARIWIYDPNHPSADDVVLEVPLDGDGLIVSKRGTAPYASWTGLFVERYAPSSTRL